jgi:hypothetical protein
VAGAAAVDTGKNDLIMAVIAKINVGFDTSEGDRDIVYDLVDELVEIEDGADFLGCFLHAKQVINLILPQGVRRTEECGIGDSRASRHCIALLEHNTPSQYRVFRFRSRK